MNEHFFPTFLVFLCFSTILLHVADRQISFEGKTMSSVYIYNLWRKLKYVYAFNAETKDAELGTKNVSYAFRLMKMWHSSFVLCDCRHKFPLQAFRISALNLIFSVSRWGIFNYCKLFTFGIVWDEIWEKQKFFEKSCCWQEFMIFKVFFFQQLMQTFFMDLN